MNQNYGELEKKIGNNDNIKEIILTKNKIYITLITCNVKMTIRLSGRK